LDWGGISVRIRGIRLLELLYKTEKRTGPSCNAGLAVSLGRYAMNEEMTIEEIESRFASEWVLIEDPKTDEELKVLGGKVLHHSKDRDEVYRKAVALRPKRSALVFTGEIPEETAVVL